jgi:hypothetical protein
MKIKNLFICLFILGFLSCKPVLAVELKPSEQAYFSVLPDIPLMPLMDELKEQSFSFDKVEGRVVETVGFLSASTPEKVIAFYQDVLKPLGWKAMNSNAFSRNNEILLVSVERIPKGLLVRLRLSPQQS